MERGIPLYGIPPNVATRLVFPFKEKAALFIGRLIVKENDP